MTSAYRLGEPIALPSRHGPPPLPADLAGRCRSPRRSPARRSRRGRSLGSVGCRLSRRRPEIEAQLDFSPRDARARLGRGRNIVIEVASPGARNASRVAAELVRVGVDVIVAASPPAVAARRRRPHDPNREGLEGDPVRTGLVPSLARPGGNVTGVASLRTALSGKSGAAQGDPSASPAWRFLRTQRSPTRTTTCQRSSGASLLAGGSQVLQRGKCSRLNPSSWR